MNQLKADETDNYFNPESQDPPILVMPQKKMEKPEYLIEIARKMEDVKSRIRNSKDNER